MTDSGRYHFKPDTEERVAVPKSAPRLRAATPVQASAPDDSFEEFRPIVERDDEPTAVTTLALNRLDEAVDDAAEVCESIGRKSLELGRRMRRKRIDSAQKLAAMLSLPPPPEPEAAGA